MSKKSTAATSLGVGLLVGGFSYWMLGEIQVPPADQLAEVQACAELLPEEPQAATEVPGGCDRFNFSFTKVIEVTFVGGERQETETTTYILPAQAEFIEEKSNEVTTEEEQETIKRRVSLAISGGASLLMGLGLSLDNRNNNPKDSEHNSAP